MKIKLNPIMKKEFKVAVRDMKMAWRLTGYELVLVFLFIVTMSILEWKYGNKYRDFYNELPVFFPLIGIAQVGMVILTVPVITASSISGEKERQTFDIMLTTALTPMEIIFGKVFFAVAEVMLYVTAGIPVMALAFLRGGYSWWTLFLFLVVIFVLATVAGSIGVFCSSISRKSVASILRTFGLYFLVCFISWLPMVMVMGISRNHRAGDSTVFLLLNPLVFLEEFFALSIYGKSLFSGDRYYYSQGFLGMLTHGPLWCICSGISLLGLSWFFMYLAARKIDPLAEKIGKIRRKEVK